MISCRLPPPSKTSTHTAFTPSVLRLSDVIPAQHARRCAERAVGVQFGCFSVVLLESGAFFVLVFRALSAAGSVQHPLFTPVSQAAGRRVAFYALAHVLHLDLHFHLGRNTGEPGTMRALTARCAHPSRAGILLFYAARCAQMLVSHGGCNLSMSRPLLNHLAGSVAAARWQRCPPHPRGFRALAQPRSCCIPFHPPPGALARMLERGARSIAMIFRAVVFTLVPTALELVAVVAVLAFGGLLALCARLAR